MEKEKEIISKWMTKNLNVDIFRNGDKIPQAKTKEGWLEANRKKQAAWCYYKFDPKNGNEYGKLYNWYAVNDKRGLAPKDWKIPSHNDWVELVSFLGGEEEAAVNLKSKIGWGDDIIYSDKYKFNAKPAGELMCYFNVFSFSNNQTSWWSSSEGEIDNEDARSSWSIFSKDNSIKYSSIRESYGLSVRCIKDENLK
jgi:uncharacterized protein (TIGR02145 family)